MQTITSQRAHRRAHNLFRLHPIAAACATTVLLCGTANAQQAPAEAAAEPAPAANTVIVKGLRRSLEDSLTVKRGNTSIVEAVSAEDLGKLPDSSIAEALARLPGVTGERGGDGNVDRVSVRGMSPEFSSTLLNGREMVSSGESRAVELDQFPSELIGGAVVYKTPDAALIGQGLAGTIDLHTRRPLATRGREVALNLRAEKNSNGTLVSDVASPIGKRFSASYIDQFADNTIGVALGLARLDRGSQIKRTQTANFRDQIGIPIDGAPPQQQPANGYNRALLPLFWDTTANTKRSTRTGLMGVLEYKPNRDLHSTLDFYYSRFDTKEVGVFFRENMYNAYGAAANRITLSNVGTTQVGRNTYATTGTADNLSFVIGNAETRRRDSIAALGWNTELKLADKWKGIADLSFSRDKRDEEYDEIYGAPFNKAINNWQRSAFSWNIPYDGSAQSFTPVNPNTFKDTVLGDAHGYHTSDAPAWAGGVRTRPLKDELKTLRLSAKRDLDGPFRSIDLGLNVTKRDKVITNGDTLLLLASDGKGGYVRDVPASAMRDPVDMSWAGLGFVPRISAPDVVASGVVSNKDLFGGKATNDYGVHERISTAYAKLDIDTAVAGYEIRGNLGMQAVHSKQNSDGYEYRGNNVTPDPKLVFPHSGGATYHNYLPSLNLIADLKNDWVLRFGLAKTMARPNMQQLRAGTSTPSIIDKPGDHYGEWTGASGGNPELKPWLANGTDLSLEKYFGKRSYVAAAAFHKKLLSYVFDGTTERDNNFLPRPSTLPADIVVQRYGSYTRPINGNGGALHGLELSAALGGELLSKSLDGFGVILGASRLGSDLQDKAGNEVKLDGLSGTAFNATAYYEKNGFSARVSERYRAPFTATSTDVYLQKFISAHSADRVVDMQLGYNFETGPYKGLSILLQANNLLDTQVTYYSNVGGGPDPDQLRPRYTNRFGRQFLIGLNYKL